MAGPRTHAAGGGRDAGPDRRRWRGAGSARCGRAAHHGARIGQRGGRPRSGEFGRAPAHAGAARRQAGPVRRADGGRRRGGIGAPGGRRGGGFRDRPGSPACSAPGAGAPRAGSLQRRTARPFRSLHGKLREPAEDPHRSSRRHGCLNPRSRARPRAPRASPATAGARWAAPAAADSSRAPTPSAAQRRQCNRRGCARTPS